VPLCLLQIQHGQGWNRTRAFAHLRGVRKTCKVCQDGRKSREDSKPGSFWYEELPTPRPLRPVKAHLAHVIMVNSRYRAFWLQIVHWGASPGKYP
jgi:hypothetical protein